MHSGWHLFTCCCDGKNLLSYHWEKDKVLFASHYSLVTTFYLVTYTLHLFSLNQVAITYIVDRIQYYQVYSPYLFILFLELFYIVSVHYTCVWSALLWLYLHVTYLPYFVDSNSSKCNTTGLTIVRLIYYFLTQRATVCFRPSIFRCINGVLMKSIDGNYS